MSEQANSGVLTFEVIDAHQEGFVGRGWVATIAGKLSCSSCPPEAPREFIQTYPPEGTNIPRLNSVHATIGMAKLGISTTVANVCDHLQPIDL